MMGSFGSPVDSKGVLGFDRMFFDLRSAFSEDDAANPHRGLPNSPEGMQEKS